MKPATLPFTPMCEYKRNLKTTVLCNECHLLLHKNFTCIGNNLRPIVICIYKWMTIWEFFLFYSIFCFKAMTEQSTVAPSTTRLGKILKEE